jgi:hypothetical protein
VEFELSALELRVAVAAEKGQFGNPGMGISSIGCRYQRTGEGTAARELSMHVDGVNWL